ncbi:cathelicidin-6-like [Ornithorhynchus anatinus]|uniref:cathelicidin-6-like n=1 Tax=Ornithorhynchus anatinus TaxID=9258 RepID=UPI0010A8C8CF|nr:cathelicidin-6-like [Ornithorhynchus anatinus]
MNRPLPAGSYEIKRPRQRRLAGRSRRQVRKMKGLCVVLLSLMLLLPDLPKPVLGASTEPQGLSYEEALARAVSNFNDGSAEEKAFRLLLTEPQPQWDPKSKEPQPLIFSIKETECPAEDRDLDLEKCEFKANGLVRECWGSASAVPGAAVGVITCEPQDAQPIRVRRGLRKTLRKLKKKLKKFLPKSPRYFQVSKDF